MMTFLWLIFRCLCPDISKSVTFLFFVLQSPLSEADKFSVVISPMVPITGLQHHETSSYQPVTLQLSIRI